MQSVGVKVNVRRVDQACCGGWERARDIARGRRVETRIRAVRLHPHLRKPSGSKTLVPSGNVNSCF